MKPRDENKLDKHFKAGLSSPEDHIDFREEDWAAMENLLDGKPSRKAVVFRLIWAASGIAAILLLTFALFFRTGNDTGTKPGTKIALNYKNGAANNHESTIAKATPRNGVSHTGAVKAGSGKYEGNRGTESVSPTLGFQYVPVGVDFGNRLAVNRNPRKVAIKGDNGEMGTISRAGADASETTTVTLATDSGSNIAQLAAASPGLQVSAPALNEPNQLSDNIKAKFPELPKKPKSTLSMAGTPRFAFSVTAAPDINGVDGLGKGQVGGNFGLQATYNVTRKLSVTTGAAYAIKPYEGNFGNYNFNLARWANRTLPSSVYANCKVLDIPINVNYQLYRKGITAWTVGAGLSSYFMLREDYSFAYDATSTSYDIQINNQNRHIFGVLNLNATYQRQMNSRFGLLIQPYYKLPITQIGYGKVGLRSAGVAVGLSYSMSSLRIK